MNHAARATSDGAQARKLPGLTAETRPFWTRGEHGELVISRCAACGRYAHPPSPVCPACLSREIQPEPVSGRATVVSYTVNHEPWTSDLSVPYVVAYVELVEQAGLWLMTNIVDCPHDEVSIGMKVRVKFEPHGDVWLPLFVRDDL